MGGDNDFEGRVEVHKYPHGWGTVCDDMFGDEEAQVACRMLGYSGGEYVWIGFGEGNGTIALDNLDCEGDERDLWECDHNDWGDTDCYHFEDAGIRCGKKKQNCRHQFFTADHRCLLDIHRNGQTISSKL